MNNMQNLIDDLSKLTNIPANMLVKLVQTSILSICHDVEEEILSGNNITSINIGIGVLYIGIVEDTIKYKFIPSNKLEASVKNTILNNKCELENKLEESFSQRLIDAYKDLF